MKKLLLALYVATGCTSLQTQAQDFDANLHKTAPSPQASQIAEANAALEAHDYDRALKLLTPLAAAHPEDATLLYDLGSAQDALDQGSAAEQSYRTAIADDQKQIAPRVALGLLLARQNHRDEARTELLAASKLEIPPDQKDGAFYKAAAFRALARLDEESRPGDARDELLEALKLSPETPEDTLLGAELAESAAHGAGAAEEAYRRVLASHPDDPEAASGLAHLLVKELRAAEAEELLTSSLKAHPGDPALTVQLATLYSNQDKLPQAIPLVEQLHAANPQDANVAHLLAGLYLDAKDYAHAEPLLATLSAQEPRDTGMIDDRARALIHLQRPAEAEKILAPIVAQPTLFPTPQDLGNAAGDLAFAASSNNDPQTALQALKVRATVLPTSAPVLFLTAISYDKLHETKLAIEAYKNFIEASKGSNPDEEFEARHRLVALEHMR
jgi:predicted Zn-dependent protease